MDSCKTEYTKTESHPGAMPQMRTCRMSFHVYRCCCGPITKLRQQMAEALTILLSCSVLLGHPGFALALRIATGVSPVDAPAICQHYCPACRRAIVPRLSSCPFRAPWRMQRTLEISNPAHALARIPASHAHSVGSPAGLNRGDGPFKGSNCVSAGSLVRHEVRLQAI